MSITSLFLFSTTYSLTSIENSPCLNAILSMISSCLLCTIIIATFLFGPLLVIGYYSPSIAVYICLLNVDFHPYNVASPSKCSPHCQYSVGIFVTISHMITLSTHFTQKISYFASSNGCSLFGSHLRVSL